MSARFTYPPLPGNTLIVASSGCMLVRAAKRAGYNSFVIDLYADCDTHRYAQACYVVQSLAVEDIIPAVDHLLSRYPITQFIYGSGFENHPETLSYISDRLYLWGNLPDVFAKIQDKKYFFAVLDRLSIPYPEVLFAPPTDYTQSWLVKPLCGQGGVGIRFANSNEKQPEFVYWQRYQSGTSHSVLFLANGTHMTIVGFNSQWSTSVNQNEFIFSGIINNCDIPAKHKVYLSHWLTQIVGILKLKGLNSLDFIYANDQCYLLEINARPSASMQLYGGFLFSKHINACRGRLTPYSMAQRSYKGYQIIYAECDTLIPSQFVWPAWCMDLPHYGALIHTGQPICSIMASHKQSQQVLQQLQIKQQIIFNKLNKRGDYGI